VKVAGDPNNPVRFKDDATAEELRAECAVHGGIENPNWPLRKPLAAILEALEE
jgi:hypothetical protein